MQVQIIMTYAQRSAIEETWVNIHKKDEIRLRLLYNFEIITTHRRPQARMLNSWSKIFFFISSL